MLATVCMRFLVALEFRETTDQTSHSSMPVHIPKINTEGECLMRSHEYCQSICFENSESIKDMLIQLQNQISEDPDLLSQFCVNGQHLWVTDKGESQDGNGVGCLEDKQTTFE